MSAAADVAEKQTVQTIEHLREDGETGGQFGDMMKMLSEETVRPPCLSIQRQLRSRVKVQDDLRRMESEQNARGIRIRGAEDRTANGRVFPGSARGERCFGLRSPQRLRAVLRRLQTVFFGSIIVTHYVTLAAGSTSTASLF